MAHILRVIDSITGEITEDRTLKSNEQIRVITETTQEQRDYYKNKWDMEALTRSLDGFVWVFYFNNELLFNSDTISKANVTRLMMLATYMNYENALVLDDTVSAKIIKFKTAVEYMCKKDIQRILNLKPTIFRKFLNEVTEAEMLIEKDGRYYLSKFHFYKGEINSLRDEISGSYTRMYVNTVRQIYNGMKTSKHNLLSYVFQLIPCIHFSTNFLCKNVASSHTNIEYMNIEDICKFLELSTDKDNMRKFKKELKSIHIECNGRMAYLINEVIYSSSKDSRQRFMFNPHVITSISQKEEINQIIKSLFIE